MAEQTNPNGQNSKQQQAQRNIQNNANNIKNAADVAIASKNPYAMTAGAAVKSLDKMTGGKSTQALGKAMNTANKFSPGGKQIQNASNKLSESGASDKIGKAAAMKNQMSGSGSSKAASSGAANKTASANKSSGGQNNSGFGNSKSGLFSPKTSSSETQSGSTSGNIGASFKKTKKVIGIISAIAPILFPMLLGIIIVVIIMSQIMVVRDNITQLANQFTTGVEKLINFAQGDGWMTNDELFFKYLDKEYNRFKSISGGKELDIPLIASTIHYANFVDFDQYEELDAKDEDLSEDDLTSLGNAFKKDQTKAFYNVAKELKLGSVDTTVIGQKRLLGHLTRTKFEVGTYTFSEATQYNTKFIEYMGKVALDTFKDVVEISDINFLLSPINSTLKLHQRLSYYVENNGDITYELRYNIQNFLYESEELLSQIGIDWNDANSSSAASNLDNEVMHGTEDSGKGIWLAIKLERISNDGYAEYKQMKQDMMDMKSILKKNGIGFSSDEEVLTQANNSSNTELKALLESYNKNRSSYMYSYTHYLQKVYIPFTYFYKKDYTSQQVDSIVDEIFDQRDFYYYLIGDKESNYSCGGSCEYIVGNKEVSNLKVRLMQCSDEGLGKPIVGEELVDFEKYILGVVYAEVGPDAPVEAAKAQAIAARSYALLRPSNMGNTAGTSLKQENGNWILSLRNCVEDQVYCDPDQGCSSKTRPTGYNGVTMYSGANTKTYSYKGPLAEDSDIRSAVSAVAGKVLLDSKGNIISTEYTSTNQNRWSQQAKQGSDYTEILLSDYVDGSSISEASCSKVCNQATGDFTQWKQLASLGAPWADVVIGNGKTINQIGCLATSVAIQIARSGVPLQNINGEFNPGTFVEAIKPNGGFVRGTLFVWNSSTIVAPTFKYSHNISLSGLNKTQKAVHVQGLINQGCYVVMEVKGNGGGEHYVAVDYVQGDEVYMMDPASTEVVTWNQYPHYWTSAAYCYKVSS